MVPLHIYEPVFGPFIIGGRGLILLVSFTPGVVLGEIYTLLEIRGNDYKPFWLKIHLFHPDH